MGAWGSGPFENDGAGDFMAELVDTGALELLQEALELPDDEYLEVEQGQAAIAAAALIAAAAGHQRRDLGEELHEWLDAQPRDRLLGLAPLALQALERVMAEGESSEIYDLWKES